MKRTRLESNNTMTTRYNPDSGVESSDEKRRKQSGRDATSTHDCRAAGQLAHASDLRARALDGYADSGRRGAATSSDGADSERVFF